MSELIRAMTLEELRARGAPQLFETDPAVWRQRLIEWWETSPDGPQRKIYPAQVEMLYIDLMAYALSLLGQQGQMAAEQRWVAFASGDHLDMLGANVSTFRFKSAPARTTIRFTLAAPAAENRIIPAGTEVSAGGDGPSFATEKDLVINAGETAGEVPAICMVSGVTGNGFMPGQISEIITPLPFEVTAENVTESTGGAAEEDDEAFRLRIAEAFERISKAGPRAAYEQMVRAFSPVIVDVGVTSPEPGVVHIHVLTDEGVPSQDMLLAIRAWIDPETRRPLTDAIEVLAPFSVPVSVEARVVARGDLMTVQQQVQDAIRQAADVWKQRLGEYLSTSAITCALGHVDEIVDIDVAITGVDNRQLQPNQFAVLTDVTVNMEAAA